MVQKGRLVRWRNLGVSVALALVLAGAGCGDDDGGGVSGPVVFAVTTTNRLIAFRTNSPNLIRTSTAISGLGIGETIVGIDIRPVNGEIYAITNGSNVYTIDAGSGVATPRPELTSGGVPVILQGTSFGVDFNPVSDRLRVVSDADQNLRINVDTGDTTVDGVLRYVVGDANAAANPNVVATAYTNNFAGTTTTALGVIDSNLDVLVLQDPPNDGTLRTQGSLATNAGTPICFDIAADGTAIAVFSANLLASVNLTTGQASFLGTVAENVVGCSLLS